MNTRLHPSLADNEPAGEPAQTLLHPTPMGRPLRRQAPGQVYLFTTRCHQARFFLRPDPALNAAVLEWLARAQQAFPDLRIHAACVLSNHLHLIVRDDTGQLAAWASYFLGNFARAVNRIRGRRGTCFERRYSAEPILDAEALLDRLVYVATNPVAAGLCARARQWPGVLLFARDARREAIPVSWIDRDAQRRAHARARRRGEAPGESADFRVSGRLLVDPIAEVGGPENAEVIGLIEAREEALAEKRRQAGRRTLTRAQVLAQNWHAAPTRPQRSPRPLCHAANPALRKAFRHGFQAFVSLFREASERVRQGVPRVSFPEWSFPPGHPLVRPALAGSG